MKRIAGPLQPVGQIPASRIIASVPASRLRSAIMPSKDGMIRLAFAGPDDRGALDRGADRALRRRDPVAQGDERERRFGQAAEDRQPHPGVGGIPGGDPAEGLQGGRLVLAAIAQSQRGLETDPDRGIVGQRDEVSASKSDL